MATEGQQNKEIILKEKVIVLFWMSGKAPPGLVADLNWVHFLNCFASSIFTSV